MRTGRRMIVFGAEVPEGPWRVSGRLRSLTRELTVRSARAGHDLGRNYQVPQERQHAQRPLVRDMTLVLLGYILPHCLEHCTPHLRIDRDVMHVRSCTCIAPRSSATRRPKVTMTHNRHGKLLFPCLLPFRPVTQFPGGNNSTLASLSYEPNHSSDPLKFLLAAWDSDFRSRWDGSQGTKVKSKFYSKNSSATAAL